MNKKVIKTTGIITTSVLLGAALISGIVLGIQHPSNELNGIQKISFFSNYPDYTGNGFNKETHDAAVDYQTYLRKTDSNYKGIAKNNKKVGMQQTQKYDDTGKGYVPELMDMYNQGADVVISSGFQVANSFNSGFGKFDGVWTNKDGTPNKKFEDKKFILLDDSDLATAYKNAVSVSFAAEGAGFESAIGAGIYTLWNSRVRHIEQPNIVMWGGNPYPTVYNYMEGFAEGISYINNNPAILPSGYKDKKIKLWSGGDSIDHNINSGNTYVDGNKNTTTGTWYTYGFDGPGTDPDALKAESKSQNALANNASVIFPVAGGNTAVALNKIQNNKNGTKIMGVDTDNTFDFDGQASDILGSATKNLKGMGMQAIWAIDDFDGDGTMNIKETEASDKDPFKNEGDKLIKGHPPINKGVHISGTLDNGGVGFTFINSNNGEGKKGMNIDLLKAIKDIYNCPDEESAKEKLNFLITEAKRNTPTINHSSSAFTENK